MNQGAEQIKPDHFDLNATPEALIQRLRVSLPAQVYTWLEQAIEAARIAGASLYLVGGPVRDLLLGHPTVDLDLVTEGDALHVAERFADRAGGELTQHAAFRTATIELLLDNEPFFIDFVTARRETYPQPAALPVVEASDMSDDLFRRDFTINALALRLDDQAMLLDPYGGRSDLRAQLVRVLHDQSFIDDPTRMLRATRFAARLGFALEVRTSTLLQHALHEQMLERTSPQRILNEIWLLLEERRPEQVLLTLNQWKVLPPLGLVWSSDWIEQFAAARALNGDDQLLRAVQWGLLVWPLNVEQRRGLEARYNLPTLERKLLHDLPAVVPDALLQPDLDAVSLDQLLRRYDTSALRVLQFVAPPSAAANIARYLEQVRSLRPLLTGGDLLEFGIPPGPFYGQLLEAARLEQIAGRITTRDEVRIWLKHQIVNDSA